MILTKKRYLIGPGAYELSRSPSFEGLATKDSYIVNDNGHLSQRTQPYAMKKKMVSLAMLRDPEPETPGPGSYEDLRSSFKSPHTSSPRGPVIQPLTVMSPISPGRAAAAISNPSLQKMSVPSIPSRFLTPIIDANQEDVDGSGDICKMSRLVDDPSKVGPGTYQIQEEQVVKSPKGAISW